MRWYYWGYARLCQCCNHAGARLAGICGRSQSGGGQLRSVLQAHIVQHRSSHFQPIRIAVRNLRLIATLGRSGPRPHNIYPSIAQLNTGSLRIRFQLPLHGTYQGPGHRMSLRMFVKGWKNNESVFRLCPSTRMLGACYNMG